MYCSNIEINKTKFKSKAKVYLWQNQKTPLIIWIISKNLFEFNN